MNLAGIALTQHAELTFSPFGKAKFLRHDSVRLFFGYLLKFVTIVVGTNLSFHLSEQLLPKRIITEAPAVSDSFEGFHRFRGFVKASPFETPFEFSSI